MIPVTYSPSWTLIPTHYCRNACGYCAFVAHTGERARLRTLAECQVEIDRAHAAGATELLVMSGEGVETNLAVRRALDREGFDDYIAYLIAVARLALDRDLLPHINIGNVGEDDLRRLRAGVPSMGMMLETIADLSSSDAHRRAPDKRPAARLETLRAAGRARMPWTTGILVGIGETGVDRRRSLEAIARIHDDYGHVQEVIIQPFTPHANTSMADRRAPDATEMRAAVRLAREVLPADVAVQIPPNIASDVLTFVRDGARDLGGISPDGDRINPSEPWLAARSYASILAPHDFRLVPRLAVHDSYINETWLAADTLRAAARARKRLPTNHELSSPAFASSTAANPRGEAAFS